MAAEPQPAVGRRVSRRRVADVVVMDALPSGPLAAVQTWICNRRDSAITITADTDLIESRLIDSLDFVEFLFFLEELTGTPIELHEVDLDAFRTLRSIDERFFSGRTSHVLG